MDIWIKFYNIWQNLIASPIRNLIDTFGKSVSSVIQEFFIPYGKVNPDTGKIDYPAIVDSIINVVNAIVPADWTVFGLMIGTFLTIFIGATLIKWIIGIVT